MSQDEALPPVLTASVHDVRYFAALLRGVNFVNRSTVLVSEHGLTITVEEARTLVGMAFIFSDIFDEYTFHSEPPLGPRIRAQPERATKTAKAKGKQKQNASELSETEPESDDNAMDGDWKNSEDPSQVRHDKDGDESNNTAFEIPLNTFIECLNIFGTAANTSSSGKGGRAWHRSNDNNAESDHEDREERRRDGIEAFFGGQKKRTSMRMSYLGAGYPLTLIIAEDATGPTTTCEITTFESEPHLELDFDSSKIVLKIILKSSWLRDALSELDPSCEKLTFIGNPPLAPDAARDGARHRRAPPARPMLRIQATGAFGSTEMDYPNDREVLETFECVRNVNFSYRFAHILRTLRSLQSSTKTSLRVDEDGLLSIQFLMPNPRPKNNLGGSRDAFIEFRCLPLDDSY